MHLARFKTKHQSIAHNRGPRELVRFPQTTSLKTHCLFLFEFKTVWQLVQVFPAFVATVLRHGLAAQNVICQAKLRNRKSFWCHHEQQHCKPKTFHDLSLETKLKQAIFSFFLQHVFARSVIVEDILILHFCFIKLLQLLVAKSSLKLCFKA